MADIEYLLPIIRSLKSDLVIARQYEAAKHIRDAECVLLPQGPPSMDERIKRLEQFIDGSSMQCSEMSQRIEKMEKNPLANFAHIDDSGQAVLDASMLPTFDVIVKSSDAFQKMENALSQEMARMREMDDILAGVVKRAGYEGEAPEDLRAGLLKWLDSEIALANNLMGDATTPVQIAQAMLATYRAVKAHIQG